MDNNQYIDKVMEISCDSKYTRWYKIIVSNARERASTRKQAIAVLGYTELHHILPRSFKLGGYKDKENYAYLSAREHFVCHLLLARITVGKNQNSMMNAALLMCYKHIGDLRYKITSRAFAALKSAGPWNKNLKGQYFGNPRTEEEKEHLRQLHKGKKRSDADIAHMKKGWQALKEKGYTPHNKGKKYGPSAKAIACVFVSPCGTEYSYPSYRQGCMSHNLSTSMISAVKNGTMTNCKGWTLK